MTDWAEPLIAAKAAIAKAEQNLALGSTAAGKEAIMEARARLWDALDIINAPTLVKPYA